MFKKKLQLFIYNTIQYFTIYNKKGMVFKILVVTLYSTNQILYLAGFSLLA